MPPIEALDAAGARYRHELTGGVEGEGGEAWLRLWVGGAIDRPERSEVFTGSTDAHGHSTKVVTTIMPWAVGEIDAWVGRGDTPYRSRGDFIRDAITHRMWDIAEGLVSPTPREKTAYNLRMMVGVAEDWVAWHDENVAAIGRVREVLAANQNKPRFDDVLVKMKEYALGIDGEFRQEALEIIESYQGEG